VAAEEIVKAVTAIVTAANSLSCSDMGYALPISAFASKDRDRGSVAGERPADKPIPCKRRAVRARTAAGRVKKSPPGTATGQSG
jgi:hypothetical protein